MSISISTEMRTGHVKAGQDDRLPTPKAATIWLEAEQFADCGGWFNDPQFMDIMGSPYLLAAGVGKPVRDAVTEFEVPQAGQYRLWVRAKDWFPSHSPGQFQVLVNGAASPIVFGKANDASWQWVDGGEFDLPADKAEVRLHDLTGWWGRCDAIVLSRDATFVPSNELDELARQREVFGGVSREAQEVGLFDVVVVGGGMAGTAAAVTAARHGARVALLQNRPILGGNGSTEVQVPPLGDLTYEPWDPREIGLIEEFDPRTAGRGPWSANLERVARAEPNLQLWLNVHLTSVEMHNTSRIAAVEAVHTQTGQRYRFEGSLFIDCTGDAWVGYHAGAKYRHGQEARSEFDEPAAPEKAVPYTMSSSLNSGRFKGHSEPVVFEHPPWAYRWNSREEFESESTGAVWNNGYRLASFDNLEPGKGRHPQNAKAPVHEWYIEFGGRHDTIQDAEFIRDELFRISIGLWDYVKNRHPEYREKNTCRELVWINYVVGKRESRRLLNDFVLTQNDLHNKVMHPDIVAYAGWVMDIHHPCGYFTSGPQAHLDYLYRTSIPFRCLFSKNIENLMMAGRNISATHLALAKTRVQRTCTLTGWAAGLGAALAIRDRILPRDVAASEKLVDEMQQTMLREGGYLPNIVNTDPRDLARQAKVAASSYAVIRDPKYLVTLDQYYWNGEHPLDNGALAVQFRAQADRIDSVALYLRSDRVEPAPITVGLRASKWLGEMSSTTDLASAEAIVPAKFQGWVEFPLKYATEKGGCYYMWLPKTKGMNWELYKYHPPETRRAYPTPPGWSCKWGCFKFKLSPGGEPPASQYIAEHGMNIPFLPENIQNGIARVVEGTPNSWAPDPDQPLPQWIELAFDEPVEFNEIHISFQMDILAPRVYSFEAKIDGAWHPVHREAENRSRRRVHSIETVKATAVRLVLEERSSTVEVPLTPVCEIRLYKQPNC